jgi:hypothetical protein
LRAGRILFHACAAPGINRGMDVITVVLLIAGAVCFGLAAANFATKVNLTALGLLFWILTALIPAVQAVSG